MATAYQRRDLGLVGTRAGEDALVGSRPADILDRVLRAVGEEDRQMLEALADRQRPAAQRRLLWLHRKVGRLFGLSDWRLAPSYTTRGLLSRLGAHLDDEHERVLFWTRAGELVFTDEYGAAACHVSCLWQPGPAAQARMLGGVIVIDRVRELADIRRALLARDPDLGEGMLHALAG